MKRYLASGVFILLWIIVVIVVISNGEVSENTQKVDSKVDGKVVVSETRDSKKLIEESLFCKKYACVFNRRWMLESGSYNYSYDLDLSGSILEFQEKRNTALEGIDFLYIVGSEISDIAEETMVDYLAIYLTDSDRTDLTNLIQRAIEADDYNIEIETDYGQIVFSYFYEDFLGIATLTIDVQTFE